MSNEQVQDINTDDLNITFDYSESFMLELMAELLRDRDFAIMTLPSIRTEFFKERKLFRNFFILIKDYFTEIKDVPRSKENLYDHAIDVTERIKTFELDENLRILIDMVFKKDQQGNFIFQVNKKLIHVKTNRFIKRASAKIGLMEGYKALVVNEDYDGMKQTILKSLNVGITETGIRLFENPKHLLDLYKISRDTHSRIPTPIEQINTKTKGGLGKKELFVVVSLPNAGKSLTMVCFAATALLHKRKVVYYTLEMSPEKIAWRLFQCLGGFKEDDMLYTPNLVLEKMNRIQNYISVDLPSETGLSIPTKTNKDIIIKGFTSKGCNVNTIYSHLTLLESQGFVPDMVVVDYADLMEGPKEYRSEKRAELSAIYTGLRDIAVERNVAMMTASQANRSAFQLGDEVITMQHIAEDIGKAAIADIMISLNQTSTEFLDHVYRIFVMKNRDAESRGEPFKVPVDYSIMSIGNVVGSMDIDRASQQN